MEIIPTNINEETGEVITEKTTYTEEDIYAAEVKGREEEKERERQNKKIRKEFYEKKQNLKMVTSELGGNFFWGIYNPIEIYYPTLSDSMLVQVMYLMTYLKYNDNVLVIRDDCYSTYRYMTKEDVKKIIGVDKTHFARFWKELLKTEIVAEQEDGKLTVSENFKRGCIKKDIGEDTCAIKIFSHCVRYLYEKTEPRSRKYLAMLLRFIPYINVKYNVLCRNPLELDANEIDLMTTRDMLSLLGLGERQEKRLIDTLFKICFIDKDGSSRSVITIIQNVKDDKIRKFITINPQFYSGYYCNEDIAPIIADKCIKENKALNVNLKENYYENKSV